MGLSIILIVLGLVGIFVLALPSVILVLAGIFIYSYITNFTVISIQLIIIFSILTIITMFFDYLTTIVIAKKYNISNKNIAGMLLSGLIGFLVLNVVGLVIGQAIGIVVFELLSGEDWIKSIKKGGLSFLGFVLTVIIKVFVVCLMVGIFAYKVIF
ncbi:DUF456 domain-containing protein [Serpentinicella alkaliphila]|uniref:DUF456 domain-containing protein n=2 Tax=Serpentinicella alkaliphila TaxID=1734049 RepID=A0A4V2T3N5_9FIRM|nr:DUF456 domain-containing protein [Serpentinicella alkaliphila]QUH25967.1 DUF456 domain-containing protein [Serpentinicella alkaliphila]TCQ02074.1 hypothetical protein EDD79_101947 [Serpentinicella alkaliphila]